MRGRRPAAQELGFPVPRLPRGGCLEGLIGPTSLGASGSMRAASPPQLTGENWSNRLESARSSTLVRRTLAKAVYAGIRRLAGGSAAWVPTTYLHGHERPEEYSQNDIADALIECAEWQKARGRCRSGWLAITG